MKTWAAISFITGTVMVIGSVVAASVQEFDLMDEVQRLVSVSSVQIEKEVDVNTVNRIVVRTENEEVNIVGVTLPVETGWDDIKVTKTLDVIKVSHSEPANGRWGYDVRIEGDELIVERWSEEVFMQVFPWFVTGLEPIKIEVPEGMIANIDVETSNARINISGVGSEMEEVSPDMNIVARTSNGGIRIDEVRGKKIVAETSNGRVELRNYHGFEKVGVETSNGAVLLWSGSAKETTVETSNSRIVFVDLLSTNLNLNTSNSSVEGSVVGKREDFGISLRTSNGSVSMNEVDFVQNEDGGFDLVESQSKFGNRLVEERDGGVIDIKTSNGDIYLIFSGGQHGDWWLQKKSWWGKQTFR